MGLFPQSVLIITMIYCHSSMDALPDASCLWGICRISMWVECYHRMYYFLIAAITNYHKLNVLMQHRVITLQFWRSEV